jgi:hypothetical protein
MSGGKSDVGLQITSGFRNLRTERAMTSVSIQNLFFSDECPPIKANVFVPLNKCTGRVNRDGRSARDYN